MKYVSNQKPELIQDPSWRLGGSYFISRLTRSLCLISVLVIPNALGKKNRHPAVPNYLYNIFQLWKLLTSMAFEQNIHYAKFRLQSYSKCVLKE